MPPRNLSDKLARNSVSCPGAATKTSQKRHKNVTGGRVPSFFCDFRVFLQNIEFDYGRTERARAMKFFLWGCGVIIFNAAKFVRRSFRRSGDTARAKSQIYYASNSVLAAKTPFFLNCFYLKSFS